MNIPSPLEGEGGTQPVRAGRVRGYIDPTLANAKRLRRDLTTAECKLWSILRSRQFDGAKFRRQQPIGPFVADFVCHEARLIIEADGGQHAAVAADVRRTAFLRDKGYRVLRFWNNDILTNLDGVAEVIRAALNTPHPPTASQRVPPSPSRGEVLGEQNG